MNSMNGYYMGSIFIGLSLVFSIFTLFSFSEVSAEEVISVNANGYKNTIIVELENDSESKVKTVRMWPGGEITFESFKSEPGWAGGKYSDGKLIIFTATNTLNSGESVKFGLVTNEKVDGINWKVLDQSNNEIDAGKTAIQAISEIKSSLDEETSKQIQQDKETGDDLYGTKKFVPDKIRVGSDVRLIGNGFSPEKQLQLYLNDNTLKSVKTDEQGNFLTTLSIPDTTNSGVNEFIIRDDFGNIQSTNINIDDAKNRFLKTTKFEVSDIPGQISFDETLTISGMAYPQSAVMINIENEDRVLEKVRVVTTNSKGEWIFEEMIDRNNSVGSKYFIFKNNLDKTTKSLSIKTGSLIDISTSGVKYDSGETASVIGVTEPNKSTTIWIKDNNKKIIHYDVFTSPPNGEINYEFAINERFSTGTYSVIMKQDDVGDAAIFGVNQYPSPTIITLMDKTNFPLHSKAVLNILGPQSTKVTITVVDSNDNIKSTDSVVTSSLGKNKVSVDLMGYDTGVYRAVASTANIQDSVKFSVGLESGSGEITLISTQSNYSLGNSILILGNTGNNARLTVTLYDPSGNASSKTDIFSDSSGNFSTEDIGIPYNGELGVWKITAHSRLDSKSIDINVSVPTEMGLLLQLEKTEFKTNETIIIKGIAQSDASRLQVNVTDDEGESIASLETPITSDGTFSLPWKIPTGIDTGVYTITINDFENTSSTEILIQ